MVYQQCGPLCPQTCQNIGSSNCHSGCAEGCFCPDGQVLLGGRCIDSVLCQGTYLHTHVGDNPDMYAQPESGKSVKSLCFVALSLQ